MLIYIAYPTSLNLQSANALQTFATLRELRARRPDTLALIPRWGRESSRFAEIGACHLPRPAIGKLSRLHRSTLLYYLEHTAFAFMCAAVVRAQARQARAVYVRQVVCGAWWSAVIGPALGLPVIFEAHDLETHNPSRAREPWAGGLLHLMDRAALTRSTAVASLTADFRSYLAQIGWRRPEDVAVIPDAYDEQVFAPQDKLACRAALGIPPAATVIAYAGMTFAHRWLDGLLAAAAQLSQQHAPLYLLLLGGRPAEVRELWAQAQNLGLHPLQDLPAGTAAPLVLLSGPRDQATLLPYLGAADVLAIPDTVTDMTASPLKLFEYMALGTPIVLPDLPALREILPAELAYSFPRRDLAGLRAALEAALADRDDQRAAQARRKLASEHTYGRRAERILALIDRIAAEHDVAVAG